MTGFYDSTQATRTAPMNETRVTLMIDQLNSGGAQRQLCMLAVYLKHRGCHVEVLVHWQEDFFAGALAAAGIPIVYVASRNRLHLAYAMRKAVRQSRPDVVIAFLPRPSILAELAGLPRRDFALIVSERCIDTAGSDLWREARFNLHRLADAVVSNSYSQRDRMIELAPYLRERTHVIINGVELDRFKPANPPRPGRPDRLRLLVLARFQPVKNPFALLEAVALIRRETPGLDLVVDWYGKAIKAGDRPVPKWSCHPRRKMAHYYRALENAIAQRGMRDRFRLHQAQENVVSLYHAADAVCLPSFREGTPNVICEAMACGLPVLASRAGDNARLVEEGRNGFLFDPLSPRDLAAAIVRFATEPPESRRRLGLEGRKKAETTLSPTVMVDHYIRLMDEVIACSPTRR